MQKIQLNYHIHLIHFFGSFPNAFSDTNLPVTSVQAISPEYVWSKQLDHGTYNLPDYPWINNWNLQLRLTPVEDLEYVVHTMVDLIDETIRPSWTPPNLYLTCALCHAMDHSVEICTVINDQGKTPGYPGCNTTTHTYDDCTMKPFAPVENLFEDTLNF